MLSYINGLVVISDESDAPTSMTENNNLLSFKFKDLCSIQLNGISMEINQNREPVHISFRKTREDKYGHKSVSMKLKYYIEEKQHTFYFTMYTSKIILYYNKELCTLDIQSNIFPDKKYDLQYNNNGMCVITKSEDLKYFLEDYPDTHTNMIIDRNGQICLSYMYNIDDCFDNMTNSSTSISSLQRLSEIEGAYITPTYGVFPIVKNIGILLKAYTDIVLAFHIKYNPIIYEANNISIKGSKLSLACRFLHDNIGGIYEQ